MGDRAFVVFTNGRTVSPLVVLEENGEDVPALLADAAAVVARDPAGLGPNVFRIDAPNFYAAQLAEVCPAAARVRSQSVGEEFETWVRRIVQRDIELVVGGWARYALRTFAKEVALEAGLVVVNVRTATWSWKAFSGHLQRKPRGPGGRSWFEVRQDDGLWLRSGEARKREAIAVGFSSEAAASRELPHAPSSKSRGRVCCG